MSGIIGEVEVLVRPVTTGFAAAAEPGIVKEGRDIGKTLSKALLAGFAIGGVAEAIKSVVEAATKQNTAFAVLDQSLKNAGLSVKGFSASLHDTLEKQARATGVSAEDLAAAMNRLVPATGNAKESLKDLNTAIGISEAYHIRLATAALALAKEETGSSTALQRYLGKIPAVTTAQDALKQRYQALIDTGAKLDTQKKAAYTAALATAKAQDAQATSVQALALAQQKFAGIPQTFAKTYQGQFDRLHVAVEQLKVAVGTELVGGLAAGAGAISNWLDKLLTSDRVQQQVHKELQTLHGDFEDIKTVVTTVGPPLLTLADHLGGVAKTLEAVALVVGGAKLIGGLTATSAAEATATASTDAYTAALVANTAAIEANTAAQGGSAVTGIAKIGEAAAGGAAKVGLLRTALTRLALIGAIAIPIEILLNKKPIDQAISGFLDRHGLPGGSNELTTQQAVDQYSSIKHVFGQKTADEFYTAGVQAGGKQGFVGGLISGVQNTLNTLNSTGVFGGGIGGIADRVAGAFTDQKKITAKADAAAKAAAAAKNAALLASEGTLKDQLAADKYDITNLNQQIADAVRTGAQAVIDAVNQAKQNLNSIGASLAAQIGTLIDTPITIATKKLSDQQDKLTAEFDRRTAKLNAEGQKLTTESDRLSLANSKLTLKNLQQSVLLPGGKQLSDDPTKAISQLNALEKKSGSPALRDFIINYRQAFIGEQQGENGLKLQIIGERKARLDALSQIKSDALKVAQDTADGRKTILTKELANLTDELNSHEITKGKFSAGVANVLRENGVTRASARRILGRAGADALFANVTGLGEQAAAITGGPQRSGNGLVPSIVKPLQTLHDQQRQINQLRHEEATKELDESKKQTKLLKDIANGKAADKFTSSLSKNPGSGSKRTKANSGNTR